MFTTGYLTNFFDFKFTFFAVVPLHEAATATCIIPPELISTPESACAITGAVLFCIQTHVPNIDKSAHV
jgi:hypothetical protein